MNITSFITVLLHFDSRISKVVLSTASLGSTWLMLLHIPFVAEVSSIPIVDDNDSLLDVYSRRWFDIVFFTFLTEFYVEVIILLLN